MTAIEAFEAAQVEGETRILALRLKADPTRPLGTTTTPSNSLTAQTKPPFQLLHSLPTELLESTLHYLGVCDLLRLRQVDRALYTLSQDSRHYHHVSLSHLPLSSHPDLVQELPSLLPGTRHLTLRSFPAPTLAKLLPVCSPERLTSLDLSFSSVGDDDLAALFAPDSGRSVGGTRSRPGPAAHLKSLRLKGCRRISDFLARLVLETDETLLAESGIPKHALSNLRVLDLSWSAVSALPLPLSSHLPLLVKLNLSTTPYLDRPVLKEALETLPSGLADLDLSHLNLTASDLAQLAFSPPLDRAACSSSRAPNRARGEEGMSPLRLVLAGNDHFTLSSLSALQAHWSTSPSLKTLGRRIEVEHGGLLLESDEEDDVRRFVEMVAGVVMREGRRDRRGTGSRLEDDGNF